MFTNFKIFVKKIQSFNPTKIDVKGSRKKIKRKVKIKVKYYSASLNKSLVSFVTTFLLLIKFTLFLSRGILVLLVF